MLQFLVYFEHKRLLSKTAVYLEHYIFTIRLEPVARVDKL